MYEQNPFLVGIRMSINGYVILVVILVFARLMWMILRIARVLLWLILRIARRFSTATTISGVSILCGIAVIRL